MKIFLSALEQTPLSEKDLDSLGELNFNLMSFYYYKPDRFEEIKKRSKFVLIDSGAHSFQKGKKVDWENYTRKYAEFIKNFDEPKVLGYFEMDVDNVIGYDKVLELRKILESVSNKIIPVWHKNRGIEDFKQMCEKYSGKIVAITGFRNEDIRDEQYLMFLKYARKHNCKVHCLGMTRKQVLDKVPFDFTDSSSWAQSLVYGQIRGKKVAKSFTSDKNNRILGCLENYRAGMEMQEHYYTKWRNYE